MTSGSATALILAVLSGPLLAAGFAKTVTPADRIAWPVSRGLLAPPHGPRLVGAAELLAAAAVVLLPGRAPALVAALAYLALTGAAVLTRGRPCACFGLARLAAVGKIHIGLNAAGALAAAALAVPYPTGPGTPTRAATAVLAAALTLGTVLAADRRRAAKTGPGAPCPQRIGGVRLYVSDDCPSCRSLKRLLLTVEPARREAVVTSTVERDSELPDTMAGLGVPCAQPLDQAGRPICAPVSGIGAVKALVDSITIAPTVVPGGR